MATDEAGELKQRYAFLLVVRVQQTGKRYPLAVCWLHEQADIIRNAVNASTLYACSGHMVLWGDGLAILRGDSPLPPEGE